MIPRFIAFAATVLAAVFFTSCGSSDPGAVLVGQTQQIVVEGEQCFREAVALDRAGKTKKAIKRYNKTATEFPFAPSAGNARFRQAQLLDQLGDTRDAFDTYDMFLKHFPSNPNQSRALNRLAQIAHAAQRGEIKTNFLGIKGRLPLENVVDMLTVVKSHAPKSAMAARAQFAIGEAYLQDGKYSQSVEAFRRMVEDHRNNTLAPEALFRVGKILLENAQRGNQNQANLDLSREAFNDYLIQFPGHKRNAEARKMIAQLNSRELQRSYEIAEFYMKTDQKASAKIYYEDIIKRTKSGKLHDAAKARLKELGN